jgi:hypothetical protein
MKNNRDTFLEQLRRSKTHGVQVTPYKAKPQCGAVSIVLLLLALACPLSAQHRDTLYVVEEEPVYDTLFVHDTLRTYDTVSLDEYIHSREFEQLFYSSGYVDSQQYPDSAKKLYRQTVTYWENHVLHNELEKIANMDSIKKYGLAALIVLGLNGLVPGQTTDIQNEKPQSKIGYYFALGVDYALCPSPIESDNQMYYDMGARLHVLNGIQFNPWLTLSLDFQFAYTHVFEDFEYSTPYNDLGFKLGLDFRYRLLNRFRWSPVIGIAAGPSLELTFYPQQEESYQYQGDCGWGAYLSQYIGYSYRYKNNKQLLFGVSWTVDFGFNYFVGIPLLGFRFEIQL